MVEHLRHGYTEVGGYGCNLGEGKREGILTHQRCLAKLACTFQIQLQGLDTGHGCMPCPMGLPAESARPRRIADVAGCQPRPWPPLPGRC